MDEAQLFSQRASNSNQEDDVPVGKKVKVDHPSISFADSVYNSPVRFDSATSQEIVESSTDLKKLVSICQQLLDLSRKREKNPISDSEKTLASESVIPLDHNLSRGCPDTAEDVWARVKPWEYRKVPVMTADEMAQNPTWDERIFARVEQELPGFLDSLWPLPFTDSAEGDDTRPLMRRLTLSCCNLYGEKETRTAILHGVPFSELINHRILSRYNHFIGALFQTGKVLMTCLNLVATMPKSASVTVGDVLVECYRRALLEQPDDDDDTEETVKQYRGHAFLVFDALSLLSFRYSIASSRYDQTIQIRRVLALAKSRGTLLGLPLTAIGPLLKSETWEKPVPAHALEFRTDDLNIGSLSAIGKLNIHWVDVYEDHLKLDLDKQSLAICWFSPHIYSSSPLKYWHREIGLAGTPSMDPFDLHSELERSWALLFATSKSTKTRRKNYGSLLSPYWLCTPAESNERSNLSISDRILRTEDVWFAFGRAFHLNEDKRYLEYNKTQQMVLKKNTLTYAEFPIFENRLRQLRAYMDNCKPKSFRDLYRDKRDTLNYYTFWGVIIFGVSSVLLGFFSLGVSAAQTVAAWKAIPALPNAATSS